jgi:hypothetical protein
MKRRTLLATALPAAAATVAGCIGEAVPAGEDDRVPAGNGTGDGDGPRDDAVTDTAFSVEDVSCGNVVDEVTVERETAGSRLVLEGVISAPDPCHTAELGAVRYDADADEVRIAVATREEENGVCTQCIAEIQYRSVVTFADGLPAHVVVVHDGDVVYEEREIAGLQG